MFWPKSSLLLALFILLTLSGCGELFKGKVKKKSIDTARFDQDCEINVDDFSRIMEQDISAPLECLGRTLNLFIQVVESPRPEYLSRSSLESFILRNRKDIKPEVLRALKAVFDINYLIYGEDPDFISKTNIDALVRLAKIFNKQAYENFKPFFLTRRPIDFESYRFLRNEQIKNASIKIMLELGKIYNRNRNGKVHVLDLNQVIDSFTSEKNASSMANVKKYLVAKRIFLGGEKDQLTNLELGRIIENFTTYVLLAMDVARFRDINFNQQQMIDFIWADLATIKGLVYPAQSPGRSEEVLFTLREAVDFAKLVFKEQGENLDNYFDLIKEVKIIFMGGSGEVVTGDDLHRLFDHGLHLLRSGHLFHRFWNAERKYLEGDRANQSIPESYDFVNLRSTFDGEKERIDQFSRILKRYRFLSNKEVNPSYSRSWRRSAEGVFEVALYEYVIKLVMSRYGCPNNTLNNKVVCNVLPNAFHAHMGKDYTYFTKAQVVDLIWRFRKVFHDAGLINPEREVKTAETITLLGSLFQYQSDNNKVFDVNEATEFVQNLLNAIKISNVMDDRFTQLVKENKCARDEFGRLSPECLREHFFSNLCTSYPDSFPMLYASLGARVRDQNRKVICEIPQNQSNLGFLNQSINTTRTCKFYPSNPTEEIYFSKGDMMSVLLAMINIETTVLRWDVRWENNIMDPDEVMDAYEIYSPALDGFLKDLPGIVKRLKKRIFQFLVKYERVPNPKEVSSLAKFFFSNMSASADRKTVASILFAIDGQGTPSKFNCDCLRDPENIPEDQTQCSIASPLMTVREAE
jgi:hypothetical protein